MNHNQFYLVSENVILMAGEYDKHGKLCARVMIGGHTLLVDRTPIQLLDETLQYIGFDLKGACNGARSILGNKKMCPIMLNPFQGVSFFPTKSPSKEDCIWFNPDHVVTTKARGSKTEVELSNGLSMIVDAKLQNFNSKLQIANQLKRITSNRGKHPNPLSFFTTSKKRKLLSKGANGKYNFDKLVEDNG